MWKKIEEHCHYPVEGRLVSRPRNKEACKWHKGDPLCEGCSYVSTTKTENVPKQKVPRSRSEAPMLHLWEAGN